MRQLLENAVYAPTRGRFKVYVIDEVHMLSNSAFNAMLKTLEEPPEHVKFILATTDPQKIPVTVLSRCLQFNLKQMPAPAITNHMAHILEAEGVAFDSPALALVARSAAGSMRDALSLLDQAIAHGAGRVEEAQVAAMLGAVDQDYLFALLEALLEQNPAELLRIASDLSIRSISFSGVLQDLSGLLTRLQIVQLVPSSVEDDEPGRERLLALAKGFSPEFIQLAYQISNIGRQELAVAPDEYSGFVMTLLRLFAFRPSTVGELLSKEASVRRPASATVISSRSAAISIPPAEEKKTTPPDAVRNISAPQVGRESGGWHEIVAGLGLTGLARELAQNCELRHLGEGECKLRLAPTFGHLQMKPSPERLQAALSEYLGRLVQVRIELAQYETETPAASVERSRVERQDMATAAIRDDGFVREAIDTLGASVVEASIKSIS